MSVAYLLVSGAFAGSCPCCRSWLYAGSRLESLAHAPRFPVLSSPTAMAKESPQHCPRWLVAAAFVVIFLGALVPASIFLSWVIHLGNDALGYVAVAKNWTEGRGFVDPILYSSYLPGAKPPLLAPVIRPPMPSVLFALPLGFGSSLVGLSLAHAVFASFVGACSLLVGLRLLPLSSATAFAIAVAWSPAWRTASVNLLAEVSAVGVLLALLAAAPIGLRSIRGALLLAVLTILGWLTRPNLGAFVPILVLACCIDRGIGSALRSRPLWTYVGTFLLLYQALGLAVRWASGFAPYEHYGVMFETLSLADVSLYQVEYTGILAFARENGMALLSFEWDNLRRLGDAFFLDPFYLYVGWLAVPGLLHGLLRRGAGSFTRRLVSVAALGFTAVGLATSWGFAVDRYPLLGVVCTWLVGISFLDDAARWAARRWRADVPAKARVAAGVIPLLCALALASVGGAELRKLALRLPFEPKLALHGRQWNETSRALCEHIDPDALVASPDPWNILFWCGNAGYLLPSDLDDLGWLHRYLDDKTPGYLIAADPAAIRVFASSPRLEAAVRAGRAVLFRVRDPQSGSRPWSSPGPLAPAPRLKAR
jgi:hypothetical protein